MRPMGWLISVQGPRPPLPATVRNRCQLLRAREATVFNRCSLTSETLRLERILTEAEIKQLGLQPGEVKLYAT